jgi:hypothetical protein
MVPPVLEALWDFYIWTLVPPLVCGWLATRKYPENIMLLLAYYQIIVWSCVHDY